VQYSTPKLDVVERRLASRAGSIAPAPKAYDVLVAPDETWTARGRLATQEGPARV